MTPEERAELRKQLDAEEAEEARLQAAEVARRDAQVAAAGRDWSAGPPAAPPPPARLAVPVGIDSHGAYVIEADKTAEERWEERGEWDQDGRFRRSAWGPA